MKPNIRENLLTDSLDSNLQVHIKKDSPEKAKKIVYNNQRREPF